VEVNKISKLGINDITFLSFIRGLWIEPSSGIDTNRDTSDLSQQIQRDFIGFVDFFLKLHSILCCLVQIFVNNGFSSNQIGVFFSQSSVFRLQNLNVIFQHRSGLLSFIQSLLE
jgi:hypothetical protein